MGVSHLGQIIVPVLGMPPPWGRSSVNAGPPARSDDSEARRDMPDIDPLPHPAWDLVDIPRYRRIWQERHGYFAINVATTRGCPFHCNWCARPIWGQRYHTRSPDNVVAELKLIKDNYNPDFIWFVDDIFGLKPGWVRQFADLVEEGTLGREDAREMLARLVERAMARGKAPARPGKAAASLRPR